MPNGNASYAQMRAGSMSGPDFSSFKQSAGSNSQTVEPLMASTFGTKNLATRRMRTDGPNSFGPGSGIDFGASPNPSQMGGM